MKNILRSTRIDKRSFVVVLCVVFVMMSVSILSSSLVREDASTVKAMSAGEVKREKIVTTVMVEKNMSLWDYATLYYTEEYDSVSALVKEIKRTNGLSGDTIYTGSYLIIPHYEVY